MYAIIFEPGRAFQEEELSGDYPYVCEILRCAQDGSQGFVILSAAKDLSRLRPANPTHVAFGYVGNHQDLCATRLAMILKFARNNLAHIASVADIFSA